MQKTLALLLVTVLGFRSLPAAAWGSYAHQQTQLATLRSVQNANIRGWLLKNQDTMLRLAVTPDRDWQLPKESAGRGEAETHFFGVDALFENGSAAPDTLHYFKLTGYRKSLGKMLRELTRNADYLRKVFPGAKADWSGPALAEARLIGSAPWRALQMYDLAVEALKHNEIYKGLVYLSALGHYVADVADPFQTYLPAVVGNGAAHEVGRDFSERFLDYLASRAGSSLDAQTGLWTNFNATDTSVLAALRHVRATSPRRRIARKDILPQLVKIIASGYVYKDSFIHKQEEWQREIASLPQDANAKERQEKDKMDHWMKVSVEGFAGAPPRTMLELAAERMAIATVITEKMWSSALEQAIKANPSLAQLDSSIAFSERAAGEAFVEPDYYASGKTSSKLALLEWYHAGMQRLRSWMGLGRAAEKR